jgi:hypothetical protein
MLDDGNTVAGLIFVVVARRGGCVRTILIMPSFGEVSRAHADVHPTAGALSLLKIRHDHRSRRRIEASVLVAGD